MSDRLRALDVLRQARDLIAQRLAERVLESEELILDDARGESYLSDIETIYDQFGMKLTHLNQLINNMPQDDVEPVPPFHGFPSGNDTVNAAAADAAVAENSVHPHSGAMIGPLIISPPALPGPTLIDTIDVVYPTFQMFVSQVGDENILGAAKTLAILLDVSEARGVQCTRVFHRRCQEDDSYMMKALQLRGEVIASSYNAALMLMAECFGLVGIEAIGVLQTLRAKFVEND